MVGHWARPRGARPEPPAEGRGLRLGLADGELEVLEPWLPDHGLYSDPLGWKEKPLRLPLLFYFHHLLKKFLTCRLYNGRDISRELYVYPIYT